MRIPYRSGKGRGNFDDARIACLINGAHVDIAGKGLILQKIRRFCGLPRRMVADFYIPRYFQDVIMVNAVILVGCGKRQKILIIEKIGVLSYFRNKNIGRLIRNRWRRRATSAGRDRRKRLFRGRKRSAASNGDNQALAFAIDHAVEAVILHGTRCLAALLDPIQLSIGIVEHFPLIPPGVHLQQKSDKLSPALDLVGHRQRFLDRARRDIAGRSAPCEAGSTLALPAAPESARTSVRRVGSADQVA